MNCQLIFLLSNTIYKNVYNFESVLFCTYLYFLRNASKGDQANSWEYSSIYMIKIDCCVITGNDHLINHKYVRNQNNMQSKYGL